MRVFIRNALIVTFNDHSDIIENAALVIDGKRLRYVGPVEKAPVGPFDRTTDAQRKTSSGPRNRGYCCS